MSENTERLTIIGWSINVEWSNGKKENILEIKKLETYLYIGYVLLN